MPIRPLSAQIDAVRWLCALTLYSFAIVTVIARPCPARADTTVPVEQTCLAGPHRWQSLPPTPTLGAEFAMGSVRHQGASIVYAKAGQGEPVLMLHGGLANMEYLADQARGLVAAGHTVILIDSRGHGRSSAGTLPLGYDLMMTDVLAVMDRLHLDRFTVVGWSDGAIIGLDLALHHPDRVTRVFAFGANVDPSGNEPNADKSPVVRCFFGRAERDYRRLSPTPNDFAAFSDHVTAMWSTQPHWSPQDLAGIRVPVWIVDGDRDEMIRQEHTIAMAHDIPGAALMLLPASSHFAFLQAPALFQAVLRDFLSDRNM